jgi:signal transduction histidine kinase
MKMALRRIREFLLPGGAERDEPFRQSLLRAAHRGLPALGIVQLLAAFLLYASPRQAVALAVLGAVTTLLARTRTARNRARPMALVSAAAALALVGFAAADATDAGTMLILLGAIVAVPFLPAQAASLGAVPIALYLWLQPGREIFLVTLTAMSTVVAAVLYHRRVTVHREQQEALRIAEALSGAQLRAQLAENAAAIGKLAAAVTHEINTPLGSLTSAIDTLLVLAGRQATATPAQQERMVSVQADLRKSIHTSTERIKGVIARLQRFINLEEAELQSANVNELLSDVAILFKEQTSNGIQLKFDFEPVPTLMCRPQLLSAVFSSLLSNAINASNGDGRILVKTRRAAAGVEIAIEDHGRGMSAEQIENIFDPGFKTSGSRIASGNWSLFNSRQIVFEHGGDIRISSMEGKGTTVWVTLPA